MTGEQPNDDRAGRPSSDPDTPRFWRTRSGHEIRFDDGRDGPVIEIRDLDGTKVFIDFEGPTVHVESGAEVSIRSREIQIEADAPIRIRSTGTLTIKGSTVDIN